MDHKNQFGFSRFYTIKPIKFFHLIHKQMKFVVLMILVIVFIISIITYIALKHRAQASIKCWVINLDKNKDRLDRFMQYYNDSDLKQYELERFQAIYGKELDIEKYVTAKAYEDLLVNEKNNHRTKHYQLTRGAVGCYLSHSTLYEKLLKDDKHDYYFIFEDDAAVLPKVADRINLAIQKAPSDWDIILFSPIYEVEKHVGTYVREPEHFWGLIGYAINKKGAAQFIEEFHKKKISMQIDSKMTLMIQQKKLRVYIMNEKVIWHDRNILTDIQMKVKDVPGIDPFVLEDV